MQIAQHTVALLTYVGMLISNAMEGFFSASGSASSVASSDGRCCKKKQLKHT